MLKYILQIVSIILTISLLFFNIFISKKASFVFSLIIMVMFLVVCLILFGIKKINRRDYKYKFILVAGLPFLLQSILYLIASRTGHVVNYSFIFENYIKKSTIFIIFLTVIVKEIIRFIIVSDHDKNKLRSILKNILLVILCVFVDLSVSTKGYNFKSFMSIYEFLALFLLPSISKNLLLNYISSIGGYPLTLSYVLIMDLYIFLLPVRPRLNMLIEAVMLLVFPYIVYVSVKSFFDKKSNKEKKKEKEKKVKKPNKIVNVITTILFLALVCLVSREFKYSMIGIGSGSMTGTIDKGDAIIYKKYNGEDNLKEKIIVFTRNDIMIVHRVVGVKIIEGKYVYQTKGDANESIDNWLVKESDIIGVVEAKIPLIAWPSVLLGEIF